MSKMYNDIVERLNNKKEELTKLQDQFKVMCHNDIQSQCFEQNAIHTLIVMQRLKSEIEELEYWEMYVRIQTTNAD